MYSRIVSLFPQAPQRIARAFHSECGHTWIAWPARSSWRSFSIVDAAASHPDSNDVERRVIMDAPCLRVCFHSVDIRFSQFYTIRTQCSNRA